MNGEIVSRVLEIGMHGSNGGPVYASGRSTYLLANTLRDDPTDAGGPGRALLSGAA